ncbi:MAG: UDP-2,4-diacetamido-2,4,6-trideoxy-beta-L-altropyranose hydrolase, partial [Advenella sp.]|nr:UDP-2,4-diacetamido-2,4,6-trideoxy-beta-L-altropyranose hydrolase [Advenella sp.]
MKIVFRADASLEMGTGHVMRCLTLANALHAEGNECHFICREHPGNLIEFIRKQGHMVHSLSYLENEKVGDKNNEGSVLAHATWLGASQKEDAAASEKILATIKPEWLVVDHYALDYRWEQELKPYYQNLLVIDDLADRKHDCNILLDQTFGRKAEDYHPWVPPDCTLLCGSNYALLRPEFSQLRAYSLERRKQPQLQRLLITMGGVDKDNVTGLVLRALTCCELPQDCLITVVMGGNAPWLKEVQEQASQMPWLTEVYVNVNNMAKLMADADFCIGAAGSTSWERCCLGLPTIMVVLAENQEMAATLLQEANAVKKVDINST